MAKRISDLRLDHPLRGNPKPLANTKHVERPQQEAGELKIKKAALDDAVVTTLDSAKSARLNYLPGGNEHLTALNRGNEGIDTLRELAVRADDLSYNRLNAHAETQGSIDDELSRLKSEYNEVVRSAGLVSGAGDRAEQFPTVQAFVFEVSDDLSGLANNEITDVFSESLYGAVNYASAASLKAAQINDAAENTPEPTVKLLTTSDATAEADAPPPTAVDLPRSSDAERFRRYSASDLAQYERPERDSALSRSRNRGKADKTDSKGNKSGNGGPNGPKLNGKA